MVFGAEDQLTNRLAGMARLAGSCRSSRPSARFQPVYVEDLAKAIATATLDPASHGGNTYEIGGPQVLTMRELHGRRSSKAAGPVDRSWSTCPIRSASLISRFGLLPGAPLTRDQWLMLQQDNVAGQGRRARGVRDPPDAVRRGRSRMARHVTAAIASRAAA